MESRSNLLLITEFRGKNEDKLCCCRKILYSYWKEKHNRHCLNLFIARNEQQLDCVVSNFILLSLLTHLFTKISEF